MKNLLVILVCLSLFFGVFTPAKAAEIVPPNPVITISSPAKGTVSQTIQVVITATNTVKSDRPLSVKIYFPKNVVAKVTTNEKISYQSTGTAFIYSWNSTIPKSSIKRILFNVTLVSKPTNKPMLLVYVTKDGLVQAGNNITIMK